MNLLSKSSIGKTSRSNLITYLKGFDEIRKLYAKLKYSKLNNLTLSIFHLTQMEEDVKHVKGDGHILIDMQFILNIKLSVKIAEGKDIKKLF